MAVQQLLVSDCSIGAQSLPIFSKAGFVPAEVPFLVKATQHDIPGAVHHTRAGPVTVLRLKACKSIVGTFLCINIDLFARYNHYARSFAHRIVVNAKHLQ